MWERDPPREVEAEKSVEKSVANSKGRTNAQLEKSVEKGQAKAETDARLQDEAVHTPSVAKQRQGTFDLLPLSEQQMLERNQHRRHVAESFAESAVQRNQQQYSMLVSARKAAYEKIGKSFKTYAHKELAASGPMRPLIDLEDI
jgi:hypothetical protein